MINCIILILKYLSAGYRLTVGTTDSALPSEGGSSMQDTPVIED
jgi:hypothetical protein